MTEDDARRWQSDFPTLQHTAHLANCSQSPQAKRVRAAVDAYLESWLHKGMDWDFWLAGIAEAKTEFARLINASPEEIAISTSASEAAASVASALDPRASRKKIVTTDAGALFFVDAYQSLGTCPVDVGAQGIDILVSGNLKYLLGIPGVAFLYVRQEIAEWLNPAVTGWFGQQDPFAFDARRLQYAEGARRFDTGTPPVCAAFAARAGLEIINEVGVQAIGQRLDHLSDFAVRRAHKRELTYVGPEDISEKSPITALRVPDPQGMETALRREDIIASARGDVLRLAPHFFTTEEDIDHALHTLRRLM